MTPSSRIYVLHSIPVWLEQTLTWLYTQVSQLPDEIESHVVCNRVANLDQFNVPNIHDLIVAQPAAQRIAQKWLRVLKIRTYAHMLDQIIRQNHIQIVHSHFGNIGWQNLPTLRKHPLKHVVTFYGRDVTYLPQADPIWHSRYADLFSDVNLVLCEGSHMANEVIKLGCPPDRVRVHHLGVSVEKIKFQPRTWTPGTPLRVLMAASFREKKGLPYALAALGEIQTDIPLEITLIGDAGGDAESQHEKQRIMGVIDQYQLRDKVRMLGFQPYTRLMEEAYQHHIFLSPSVTASTGDTEGGAPVSLIDMSASGMLIVSTTHCDIPEVIRHSETGLLAAERDVAGLITHLSWLAEHPEKWPEMMAAGRAHIEAEYNAQIQAQRLADLYQAVIHEH